MKKINVAVLGANGRMGVEISHLLFTSKDFSAALAYSRHNSVEGYKQSTKSLDKKKFKNIDVIIDFTQPEFFSEALSLAAELKIPIVSGTTGIGSEQQKKIKMASKKTAVLWAPNMSLGVAVLSKALGVFTKLKGFDFQIEEFHHKHKKDKPSGTALFLQKKLDEVVGQKNPEPLAIRGGGIFGVHKVYALSDCETIEFTHSALNRTVFAQGALTAARWIVGKKPGNYAMRDVLL